MRVLVSVRNEEEALVAADGGVDFIDLKEPQHGALGGLPPARIRDIVRCLRSKGIELPVSATIGDLPMQAIDRIARAVDEVAACGVDYVKVGIERGALAAAVLDRLAACGQAIVPVFIADRGLDMALVAHACRLGFPGLMADTADKLRGSLFDCVTQVELQRFVSTVRDAGRLVGLAGALRVSHLPLLRRLGPDFAGFRSAVCAGDRSSTLDAERLGALMEELRTGPPGSSPHPLSPRRRPGSIGRPSGSRPSPG